MHRRRLHYSTTELPPDTEFAENDLDITLASGDASTVEARLLPVRREMKIVDEGEILEEAAPADKGQWGRRRMLPKAEGDPVEEELH